MTAVKPSWTPLVSPTDEVVDRMVRALLAPPSVDPIVKHMQNLERILGEFRQAISNLPPPTPPTDIDPISRRLDGLGASLSSLEDAIGRIPVAKPTSLEPVLNSIAKLGKTPAAVPTKAPVYDFEIERDAEGKIIKVTARPQSTARTILKG